MGKLTRVSKRVWKSLKLCFGYPNLSWSEQAFLSGHDPLPGKRILIDFGRHPFHRTLYALVKFFHVSGYQVVSRPNRFFFSYIKNDPYSDLLIKEGIVSLEDNPKDILLCLSYRSKSGLEVSDDYFSTLNRANSSYHVPTTMHPNFYHKGIWKKKVEYESDRMRSVFIAGNFLERRYKRIDKENVFKVINRIKLMKFLKGKEYTFLPGSREEFFQKKSDFKVVIVNTEIFDIPMETLRQTLSGFAFFLAAPGVSVPFSHNVIEAMSVGCIPVIEKSYAEMFYPSLIDQENALIFYDLESLDEVIAKAFTMTKDQIDQMISNVSTYYNQYLTPEAVVSKIVDNKPQKIYLLSYSSSSGLYKKYLNKN